MNRRTLLRGAVAGLLGCAMPAALLEGAAAPVVGAGIRIGSRVYLTDRVWVSIQVIEWIREQLLAQGHSIEDLPLVAQWVAVDPGSTP